MSKLDFIDRIVLGKSPAFKWTPTDGSEHLDGLNNRFLDYHKSDLVPGLDLQPLEEYARLHDNWI